MRALIALAFLLCTAVDAQTWPTKPVKFVVPSPPAGSPDRVTRLLAERLSQRWGQPVLVENRAGGTTMIGTEYVARQPADGSAFLSTFTSFVQVPALFEKIPYDPLRDFVPVTQTISVEVLLIVRADAPWRSYQEFIAAARAANPPLSYASFGTGSSFHIYGETLKRATGVSLLHVPYKGEAAQLTDLLGGHLSSSFNSVGTALPQIRGGKVRPLAIVSAARSKALPDVPAFPELGVPRLDGGGWFGLLAPAGTPRAVVDKVASDVAQLLADPEVAKSLRDQGLEPVGSTPEAFAQFIRADLVKWRAMVQEVGIKPE
jgi:tripartite-type tricarboxylate transporter receptor subunit TctC